MPGCSRVVLERMKTRGISKRAILVLLIYDKQWNGKGIERRQNEA